MDKLRRALSGDDQSSQDEETGIMGQISDSLSLSKTTRIKGFIILFLVGLLCSLFGSICLFLGLGLAAFAVFYTIGNIVSIASTCFLMGPLNQLKKMFAPTRVIATVMVIVMFCLTLFAAFVVLCICQLIHLFVLFISTKTVIQVRKPPLVLLFMIMQSLALTWYSLSYIPYARDVAKKAVSSCLG